MSHNHTFRHAGSYKYRIVLTFVKPRGGEGQNGRLKCRLGFLVIIFLCSSNILNDVPVFYPLETLKENIH